MTRRYLWARCLQRALVIKLGKACYDWAAIRTRRSRHLCRKEWAMFEKPYHRSCGCASAVIKKSVHALIGCCLGNNQSHDMSESILFLFSFFFFWGMLKNLSCCFHLTSMVHFWLVTKIKNFPFYFFFVLSRSFSVQAKRCLYRSTGGIMWRLWTRVSVSTLGLIWLVCCWSQGCWTIELFQCVHARVMWFSLCSFV